MPTINRKLLIVDDEVLLRSSLSQIFTTFGYSARTAEDGFAALAAIENEVPDILLSDLNMPGMSGFELLSVIRRRFPAIQVIAMSGAFSGNAVPAGVVADAFYEKGSNPCALLEIVRAMSQTEQSTFQRTHTVEPILIPKNGHDPSGAEFVIITCPQCLRTFPQILAEALYPIYETGCTHCSGLILYAIVPPAPTQALQGIQGGEAPPSGVVGINQ
ncbi:MAG: response regulator [Edaphobacter sp.]